MRDGCEMLGTRRAEREGDAMRIVSGFKIGWKWGSAHPSHERFMDEPAARSAIAKYSETEHVPVENYRIEPCFLLELQTERQPPLHFDLGNPVKVEG